MRSDSSATPSSIVINLQTTLTMKLPCIIASLLLGGWLLIACQQNKSNEPRPDTDVPAQGTPTEAGKPVGPAVQKTIGPAGGRIVSHDQVVTLVIPPGALMRDTTIVLQPVENKAWGGTGLGYELSPRNLEFAKPAELIWNYTDPDIAGSAPEALGIAFQQADYTWQGRRSLQVDKLQKKVSASVNKLLPAAFYESYYMVPSQRSVVPGEYVDLKVLFHAGHEDESELAPLTMPTLLKKEDVKNWKINGHDATGLPDPKHGALNPTGNGASATYIAPNRVPNPNQVSISVEVGLKSKAKLILISNFLIEAANAFQLAGAKADSAEVATISVVGNEFFQISLSERALTEQKQAMISLSMLPFPGVGSYSITDERNIRVNAMDRDRKSWSDTYYSRTGDKLFGPVSVTISEYDRERKRVKGKISGTLHHYDEKTDKHQTTQATARFSAASPY